jgi:hypothetical protein
MFRTKITFEQDAVVLDDEHVPFATIDDANVEEGVLVLAMASGTRRIKLNSGDAMTVLDGVLDGIERAHPKMAYRSPSPLGPGHEPAPHARPSWRRTRTTSAPDLMIGRTFTAG